MKPVYIVSARRTAIGTFGGSLKDVSPVQLGKTVVEAAVADCNISSEVVAEVVFGNVLGAGQGQNIARQIAIASGLDVPAFSVNKVCGSGLKAVQLGWQAVVMGDAEIVVAGGTESMNQAPYVVPKEVRFGGLRMGNATLIDTMVKDGLWCAANDYHMGVTAENLAKQYAINREAQDAFALQSQQRAQAAIASGVFKAEIVPLSIVERKETKIFDTDEHPRETSVEALAKLRPAFDQEGTVTAGNASGINDGAAAVILASEAAVKRYGLNPLCRIIGFETASVDPAVMGFGPVPAVQRLVGKTGISLDRIERFELNEAFAAQSLAVMKGLKIEDRAADINVRGGAVALGHPIGASGARILVTLLHGMLQDRQKIGLVALCIGGGQGICVMVESL